jgi:hypothetical protein
MAQQASQSALIKRSNMAVGAGCPSLEQDDCACAVVLNTASVSNAALQKKLGEKGLFIVLASQSGHVI